MILSIINLFFYDFIKNLIYFLILSRFFHMVHIFEDEHQPDNIRKNLNGVEKIFCMCYSAIRFFG